MEPDVRDRLELMHQRVTQMEETVTDQRIKISLLEADLIDLRKRVGRIDQDPWQK